MISLTRSIRFTLGPPGANADGNNGYAGRPAMQGLGAHYELVVRCQGEIDPGVGYLIDIQEIDRAAREVVLPALAHAADASQRPTDAAAALRGAFAPLAQKLRKPLAALRLNLTPYYSLEIEAMPDKAMSAPALLRQRFDFAAAHRLHVPELSDDENRRLFGKCNNPNGHGHNYQVEPCVAVPPGAAFSLLLLENLTKEAIIDRFDHKHLNLDTKEFGTQGLNPSVENIAKVAFGLLSPMIQARGATLRHITVWETDRTCATYPG